MKRNSFLNGLAIVLAFGLLSGCVCRAQTVTNNPINQVSTLPAMPSFNGGLQQIYDAATSATNYGIVTGMGRSTTGQRSLAFVDLAYNFTPSVGLIIGYDYLWASPHLNQPTQSNLVKGGVNLQAAIHPFKNLGIAALTNLVATPFGYALVASGSGTVSEILGTGLAVDITTFGGFNLGAGIMYESRTGAGFWDGSYLAGFVKLSHGF